MPIEIRLLDADSIHIFDRIADNVFDHDVDSYWARIFLDDPRHHMFVALENSVIVGMVSAVDYVHPDKAPQLFINEVGTASTHRRMGIARMLLDAMLAHGRTLGCTEAWLGTEEDNDAARALYESAGSKPERFVLYSFMLSEGDGNTQPE